MEKVNLSRDALVERNVEGGHERCQERAWIQQMESSPAS